MIEEGLFAHLIQIEEFGNRIYPLIMPQNCKKPALVYTLINSRDEINLCGCIDAIEVRVQIDIFAKTYIEVKELTEKVKNSLYSFAYPPISISNRDIFEEDTELYRELIEFYILK